MPIYTALLIRSIPYSAYVSGIDGRAHCILYRLYTVQRTAYSVQPCRLSMCVIVCSCVAAQNVAKLLAVFAARECETGKEWSEKVESTVTISFQHDACMHVWSMVECVCVSEFVCVLHSSNHRSSRFQTFLTQNIIQCANILMWATETQRGREINISTLYRYDINKQHSFTLISLFLSFFDKRHTYTPKL